MTPDERAGLFRAAIDVVRDRVPVLLCAAHSDVRVVKELSALAASLGGIPMVTPPFSPRGSCGRCSGGTGRAIYRGGEPPGAGARFKLAQTA